MTPTTTLPSAPESPVKTLEAAPTLDASSRELTTVKTRRGRRRWIAVGIGGAGVVAFTALVGLAQRRVEPSAPAPPPVAASLPAPPVTASAIAAPPGADSVIVTASAASSLAAPSAAPSAAPPRAPKPATAPRRGEPPPKKDPLEGQY